MAHKIKGPITFKKGIVPEKLKEWISKNGIRTPFDMDNFGYSNTKLDNWFVGRKGKDKYKMDRQTGKMKKEASAIDLP